MTTVTRADTDVIKSDPTKRDTHPDGSFKPSVSVFRNFIEVGGRFEPEKDRYRLYVSYTCPYATRTLIARKMKGLEDLVPITVLSPRVGKDGWAFSTVEEYDFPGSEPDPQYNCNFLRELYLRADSNYSGRITVPMLWDKKTETIVNNESAEIVRMFNTAFNHLVPAGKGAIDIYPEAHRTEIDELNEYVYDNVNSGVYKAGFALTQEAYDLAVTKVFEALDSIEKRLLDKGTGSYLVGEILTEADIRLWVSAIRFDVAYVGQFKCNIRTIRAGYPAINAWMKNIYWKHPAFNESTDFEHIKQGYYWSLSTANPHRIVPVGPVPPVEPL